MITAELALSLQEMVAGGSSSREGLLPEDLRLTAPEPPTIRSAEVTVNFSADHVSRAE
jgi:hypothetical protein